ncbi:MAG: aminoglycoside phosphotransferase family protein [Ardenticatenaceae bacterium]|nr:aminoglycoside phosphotransferase family protein [Ardenticatenaceae bacterium]
MHANEVETSVSLVQGLLRAQFPQWAGLPLRPVASAGTDNALYRLGDDLAVRLPRIEWAVAQVEKEHTWLPRLAPHLPLAVPQPLAQGTPGPGYPYPWSVYRWLAGENISPEKLVNPVQTAVDLAQFIVALQQIDVTGAPRPGPQAAARGKPLRGRDAATRQAIADLSGMIDAAAATAVWEAALLAPDWQRPPVWFHGDLLAGNLLFVDGRLQAVIDFGATAVGDPACDLMIAWGLFSGESRAAFREALGVDAATWARGRGFALSQAVIFIPYYLETNPVGVAYAQHTLAQILADGG